MLTSITGMLSVVALCALSSAARPGPESVPHLRPLDARAGEAVKAGLSRSLTFKALVDELERSDVVVYVYTTPYLSQHVSGGMSFVGVSSSLRFVKVALALDLTPHQSVFILAHELHHAAEIARATDVRTQADFDAFYRHIDVGGALPGTFDTLEAQLTGLQVRRELAAGPGTIRDPRR